MINNLCQEILLPEYSFKWADIIQASDNYYDLSELPSFRKMIKNLLPVDINKNLSLSAHLDILSNFTLDVLEQNSSLASERLSISEFKEIYNLLDKNNETKTFISLLINQLNIHDLLNGIDTFYGLQKDDFIFLLEIRSFQEQHTFALNTYQNDYQIISLIRNHILKNFISEPHSCLIGLKKFISINSVDTPILKNNFSFDNGLKYFTVHNNIQKKKPFNFFKYQKDDINYFNKRQINPTWFETLSHLFNANINDFDASSFLNITNSLAKTIYNLQCIKNNHIEFIQDSNYINKYLQLTQQNEYLNCNFLNVLLDELTTFTNKDGFESYHASQLVSLLYLFKDSILDLNPFNKDLEYYQTFYYKCDNLVNHLRCKFPEVIKDLHYNMSKYSVILIDLFSKLEINEIVSSFNQIMFSINFDEEYSVLAHIKKLLGDYPLDYSFSYTSLLKNKKDIEFDVFGNIAILYRNKLYENISDIQVNKHISVYHQIHNKEITKYLSSDKFQFINSLNNLNDLNMFYEMGNQSIKDTISSEMKSLISYFMKPLKIQSKFSLHDFNQFNLAQEKDFIETTLFQQLLFRDLSIGLPQYIPLFFDKYQQPNFFHFLDEDNIQPVLSEMKYFLTLFYNKDEGINIFERNRHWFFDKSLFIQNYILLVEFISDNNFSTINKQELIDYNKNILSELPYSFDNDSETSMNQIFHELNLKLSLTYKKDQSTRVKQKI